MGILAQFNDYNCTPDFGKLQRKIENLAFFT